MQPSENINKALIKKRFEKSLKTYKDYASVQKQMAQNLLELINNREVDSILEFGSGVGILTELINSEFEYKNYYVNDLVEASKQYIDKISDSVKFLGGDIEHIEIPKDLDLIVSNAAIQWIIDVDSLLEKFYNALKDDGVVIFTTFGKDNYKEIKQLSGKGLRYRNKNDIELICQKKFIVECVKENLIEIEFDNPKEVLKHIQKTGTNALSDEKWNKSDLIEFEKNYIKEFSKNEKVVLTYNPYYFVLCKKS